jgi:hypothetical protein
MVREENNSFINKLHNVMKQNKNELVLLSQDEFEALEMLQIKGGAGGPDGVTNSGCNTQCTCTHVYTNNCPPEID